ncbi:molybdopterin dehydrogenase [Thermosipho melanesiensis]|uniref:Molybdopterin dehydrogenase, FAD-binding n=2 Tax=Thermosipho melanesiensis TaxID=46541 RepID=A6LMM0_THEM4|nr:FAD binding domain-containing protein [Thermosipho melanesiensis]ABR31171.1 molybdopterin dehydrogenase, FAD-binding [Thermosipho melanesiensis BI429]APT74260.1 molybdopterin dehydrogenase [Thermosipho melanesiensis]OOC36200.1 molybdopterin dehydrogenase [Thermosipho melanesiensis]OOC37018.1 molybdopterin dehydrogenase [Thermosipho melanesiensis]OOC37770.1 molybdopterin dehydrogenase [Thermosipho melanesiensis]
MIKKYFSPTSLEELENLKSNINGVLFSGGTDLFVKMRYGIIDPEIVIDTKKINTKITCNNRKIFIPMNITYTELLTYIEKEQKNTFLKQVIKLIGSPMIRNRGTPIGNIANASPAGDFLLVSYLLNGQVLIKPSNRIIPIENFVLGPSKINLSQNEFIYGIELDIKENYKFYFEKIGRRNAMVISISSIALLLKEKDGKIEDISVCYGSVAPTILRNKEFEKRLIGEKVSLETFKYIASTFEKLSTPIDDIRATKDERKKLVHNLTIKAFHNLKGW